MLVLYDQNGKNARVLKNATKIGYTQRLNDLYTASFRLPSSDPDNQYVTAHCLCYIGEHDKLSRLYRVIGQTSSYITGFGEYIEYSLEHVIATLNDDIILDKYTYEAGHTDDLERCITKILEKQTESKWSLAFCDCTEELPEDIEFENETLMSAFFKVFEKLEGEYLIEYGTGTVSGTWVIGVSQINRGTPTAYIRSGYNLLGLKKSVDYGNLITRLYCRGHDGLKITSVEPEGLQYIDSDTQEEYGIVCGLLKDDSIKKAKALYQAGQKIIAESSVPVVEYDIDALDRFVETESESDKLQVGTVVRVLDADSGTAITAIINEISKSDVIDRPQEMTMKVDYRYEKESSNSGNYIVAYGNAMVGGSASVSIDYSDAHFTQTPVVLTGYSAEQSTAPADNGLPKVYRKTKTGAKIIMSGSSSTTHRMSWIAIGR